MVETLERPPEEPVARRWPIVFYGVYCLVGVLFSVGDFLRHGLAHPLSLATACIMFFVSLTGLVITLRSNSPLTYRSLRIGLITVMLLFGLLQYLRM
jgi:hypothetical protein